MKKQITKITLKTDKIVALSYAQTKNLVGGMRPESRVQCSAKPYYCPTEP
ncbi:class I lanthipeptide [Spirosoma sp. BT702]|uniref:Class I lanthipeptide n=1 Tax=Spirosoma profusum TaxID=2771354 RepID=A0A927AQ25_9BACT|nr:class I lanthipeptide [Spirosoma profusum]MBD2699538.1 class I lanthipeptide [Spirosoma profusum]